MRFVMNICKKLINRFFKTMELPAAARRAGYVSDQFGIRNRYLRESDNWKSHIDNTRRFILDAAQKTEKRGTVTVLGSGWLYDVPLDELSQMSESVVLVDIVHPEPVRIRAARLPNVRLITADLTGGAVQQAMSLPSFQSFTDWLPTATFPLALDESDLVVSVNLLNQLDIILCDYLAKRFRVGEGQLLPVRKMVQQNHISWLPAGRTCLITDYRQIDTPVGGGPQTEKPLIHADLSHLPPHQEWNWVFDTNQRYSEKNNTVFKVMAVCF